MLFGATAFAESTFAGLGFTPNAFVNVLGSRLNVPLQSSAPTFTANGDAQLSTTQKKFGDSSLLLDGTGDFVKSTNSNIIEDDFTIEFFAYASSFAQDAILWDNRVSNSGYAVGLTTGSQIKVIQNTQTIATSFGGFVNNSFNHVAISRSSGTIRVFVNGNLKGTLSVYTNNYTDQPYYIGSAHTEANFFDGYIDEFRASSVARYTSAFTPPSSEFTVDTDTGSLLHFDGANGSTNIVNSVGLLGFIGEANLSTTGSSVNLSTSLIDAQAGAEAAITGNRFNFNTGAVTLTGDANFSVTGNRTNLSFGTVDPPDQTIGLSGERIDESTGTVTTTADANISPSGSRANFNTGTVGFKYLYDVTGSRVNANTGTVTIVAKAVVLPDGQQLNFALGDTDIVGKANVSVTGNRVNVTIGDPTVKANATVIVSGKQSNLATGTVTIVAKANILPAGTRINAGTSTVNFKIWDGIVPGANQVWTEIPTP